MKTKSKIPVFKNYQEEAKFWDTHSITDFMDELKPIKITFKLKSPKEDSVVIRLQKPLKRRLEEVAANQGLSMSTMIRMWMIDRLRTI
ncbi:hypothetical protein COS78_02145 [Candidatus Shapirobacteria bacterium CG06_land_8_20_14_3_00_40_12]|uniref:Uncharacterized protein n=3 Tax=Candidatus Shapironibacteriota TaxID=1752721 RepID=A0A2M7TUQ3_9BACT|nr:MAG: hypothetical protein COS78_02145 [Candidatus Shapirobacteria bacterium CG06_land_8_20_14_3_00_40_12]PIX67842.1 MAG: hypothetical protein COZ41_02805 [Candidatus Shapirobacteria bacterium CG_4_10_14_3_um_filter_35_13]PIZ61538.1 MAG: hypothetical protein COY20_00025 [Candidatus Shapirobacteria bacterium CG_4_10_14_0_2_um_filter_40_12]